MLPPHIQRRVAHLDVLGSMVFPSSISFWHSGGKSGLRWVEKPNLTEPIRLNAGEGLALVADSNAMISAPHGGLVHISGDLNSRLEIAGHHEVIICGDIAKGATLDASGYPKLFIGGSVHGKVAVSGASKIWVDGDFTGQLVTGVPSTHVYVLGNFSAEISTLDRPALLSLAVGGFAAHDLIASVASLGYTAFHATVGRSDVPAGLYPEGAGHRKTENGNSFSRWCVLAQGVAGASNAVERPW